MTQELIKPTAKASHCCAIFVAKNALKRIPIVSTTKMHISARRLLGVSKRSFWNLRYPRRLFSNNSIDTFVSELLKCASQGGSTDASTAINLENMIKDFLEKERLTSTLEVGDNIARIDINRASRNGFPEVIFGAGKTAEHIATIMQSMYQQMDRKHAIIATKVDSLQNASIQAIFCDQNIVTYLPIPKIAYISAGSDSEKNNEHTRKVTVKGKIAVLCAGTSDFAVAEEAAILLELSGVENVTRLYDVGVAGAFCIQPLI